MEKKSKIIRVALVGPESTAKSTLAEALAKHYNTIWVPEYSRTYLAKINRKYTIDDIVIIAKKQLEEEKKLISNASKYIFVDTELIISKVWSLDVFKTCPKWINTSIVKNKYDIYLLTYPDIPWENDPLRENPHRREFFFNWYENELKKIKGNYFIIKGEKEQRMENAVEAINSNIF